MKENLLKIKKNLFEASGDLVERAGQAFDEVKEKGLQGAQLAHEGLQKLGDYLKSEEYEKDLDEVIYWLYIHNPGARPKADQYHDRNERIFRKSLFIKNQAALLVAGSALVGGKLGFKVYGPPGAANGAAVGTAVGVTLVAGVAGYVLIERWKAGEESVPRLKVANAVQLESRCPTE